MAKARTLAGLDVHAAKIVAAVLDVETGEVRSFRLPGDVTEAAAFCAGLARPVRATYEPGPTGYGLARELQRRGIDCLVRAGEDPARGERSRQDRPPRRRAPRAAAVGGQAPRGRCARSRGGGAA